ncbi:MAG: DUF998 domain-containing protein [Fimbriimonadales bacterium]
MTRFNWSGLGVAAVVAATASLLTCHIADGGRQFSPVHNWLSEFVLSNNPYVEFPMRAAFVFIGLAAFSVAMLSRDRLIIVLFLVSAVGLVLMMPNDTDPNDGRHYDFHWPLTPGNVHQICLTVAIGATIIGMALATFWREKASASRYMFEAALLAVLILATVIQFIVVLQGYRNFAPVQYGGFTERVIVLATFGWVISYCSRAKSPLARE